MVQYPKVRCFGHKSTPLVSILSQMSPLHTLQSLFIKIQFNVSLQSCWQLRKELWSGEACLASIRSGYSKMLLKFSHIQQRLAGNPEDLLAVHFSCCWVYAKSKFVQGFWVNLTDLMEVTRLLNRISYSFLNCLTSAKANSWQSLR